MELKLIQPSHDAGVEDFPVPIAGAQSTNSRAFNSYKNSPFIEANTTEIDLLHLRNDCIIPVFAKDNERTISHQEFIQAAVGAAKCIFGDTSIEFPEIRVSHQIKGRTPEAIHKPVIQLLDHEKTVYYERMAFIARIPNIVDDIDGNLLALTIGGVRSYHYENLYNKKGVERFKFFIGFQNRVCCNLCISTDGYKEELRAFTMDHLQEQIFQIIKEYRAEKQLESMKSLTRLFLTEQKFAQLLGKCRLYQHLPKEEKNNIPPLQFNDGQFNSVAKDYYNDNSFSRNEHGDINLWKMYNLFTHANKSSYIDTFLDRNVNALELSLGIADAVKYPSAPHGWYLG